MHREIKKKLSTADLSGSPKRHMDVVLDAIDGERRPWFLPRVGALLVATIVSRNPELVATVAQRAAS